MSEIKAAAVVIICAASLLWFFNNATAVPVARPADVVRLSSSSSYATVERPFAIVQRPFATVERPLAIVERPSSSIAVPFVTEPTLTSSAAVAASIMLEPGLITTFQDICTVNGCFSKDLGECFEYFKSHKYPYSEYLPRIFNNLTDNVTNPQSLLLFLPRGKIEHQQYIPLKAPLQHIAGMGNISWAGVAATFRNCFTLMYRYGVKRVISLDNMAAFEYEEHIWYLVKSLHVKFKNDDDISFLSCPINDYTNFTIDQAITLIDYCYFNAHIDHAIHCSAGHGRTGAIMFLFFVYLKVNEEALHIYDNKIYSKLYSFKKEFSKFYCAAAAEEMFELGIGEGRDYGRLFVKRVNTIVATIAVLNLKQSSKHPSSRRIYCLDLNSIKDDVDVTAAFVNKPPNTTVNIHYPAKIDPTMKPKRTSNSFAKYADTNNYKGGRSRRQTKTKRKIS